MGAEVRLLGLNDLHGHLTGRGLAYTDPYTGRTGPVGGVATLAAMIRQRRRAHAGPTFVVHSGDMTGGSPAEAALLRDEPVIRVLNQLGLLVGTPGNHEFGAGLPEFLRLVRGGDGFEGQNFPLISANILHRPTGRTLFPPYLVTAAGGTKIGFIGATVRFTPLLTSPGTVDDLDFLDEVDAVRACLPELRAQGVHAIVLLLHEGGHQQTLPGGEVSARVNEIAASLPEIGVVMAAHTHHSIHTYVGNTLVMQAAPFGRAFCDVRITLDPRTGRIATADGELVPVWADGAAEPDVAAIVDHALTATAEATGRVVAVSSRHLVSGRDGGATHAGESPLGNLLADAMRATTGAHVAFTNPGGMRAAIPAGAVTWGDLFGVLPSGNDLISCTLTGAQIWELLAQQRRHRFRRNLAVSGLHYRYRPHDEHGGEVVEIRLGPAGQRGAPIRPDASQRYRVAVNSFLAAGGDGYRALLGGAEVVGHGSELGALVEYVATLPSPFDAAIEDRIVYDRVAKTN
ncbi:bifunctional metallophosphatase/5'-nucleotidase [Catellatospora citrea]|uniref:Bifunctional metallophosphatase/5'-nucleotidase n=1 Tax=Catellatospora citrea TaxID=53366 RepID=A0A8J3KRN8_9ACTN|nr:bifunctional metallophosphatase/5'-nucleotidase [Catellatospora citrea]RKE05420.1 5'-nucleotidase [Catellatospora citrea]GIG00090.1 bifunctional metallophosphatase/5'-nucleotidase [Catellatospora citrea]